MLPTLGEIVRGLIYTGPLLSQLVCDKFQHIPIQLGDEAVITSRGYPVTPYEPLTKCVTSFYPLNTDTRVQLDCADVQTDGSRMDWVSRLLVGGSDYLLLVTGLTWSQVRSTDGGPVRRVGEPGQVVRVGFFTDPVGTARGFSCTVRGVRAETPLACGVRQLPLIDRRREARILGGTTQAENQWPWSVQLFLDNAGVPSLCTGTLITPRDVLTSAHCLPTDGTPVRVVPGALRLGSGLPITTTDYQPHPDFQPGDTAPPSLNDIGVLRLPYRLTYSAAVRPVCLPRASDIEDPDRGTVFGWGQREFGGDAAQDLQAVTMPLTDETTCNELADIANIPGAQVLCARPNYFAATPCASDSGGALVTEDRDTAVITQFGITFAGENCTTNSRAMFFTRVRSFVNFIQANTDWVQEP
ncbi:Serine protease hepsin [Amphibalanus amphitrite]|uniref:Serine protease hepsin n=1 Tax=Amphibalanus amphitrite TaxID=1232801 RepID=A0A6A4X9U6_AMPAM|nr:Serine protease hepsin [Amphibalanus amphitrite]